MYNIYLMYRYSKHIVTRMQERDFSEAEIITLLDRKAKVVVAQSFRDPQVDVYLGEVGGKYIALFINREDKILITIRPMRPKEKKYYEETIK